MAFISHSTRRNKKISVTYRNLWQEEIRSFYTAWFPTCWGYFLPTEEGCFYQKERETKGKADCRRLQRLVVDVWKETAQMPDSSSLLEKKSCSFNNICEASSSHEKAYRNGKEEPGSCKASLFTTWRSMEVLTSSVHAPLNLKTVTFFSNMVKLTGKAIPIHEDVVSWV